MIPPPYKVSVSDEALDKLRSKLEGATFPDELADAGWDYGAPLDGVKRLANYWKDGFDWRKAEAKINELPQFMTKVPVEGFGDIDVHFVHQPSPVYEAIPLLFCHGWPGSFLEVAKILPHLKGSDGLPAFHVVAPSLPNFGFSEGVKKKGFSLGKYAEACHNLMLQLGYNEYVTQGGDWGFYITRMIGALYPDHCLASHINMVRTSPPSFLKNPILALQHALLPYTALEKRGLARADWFNRDSSGYRAEQSTKPQTLGYSLTDSSVGLLAWIYEKLHDWTDSYPWTDDEVLTWVSVYWFSAAGPAASLRIYYEATHGDSKVGREATMGHVPRVKLGLAYFPEELGSVPKTWARKMGPVVFESEHASGGHFAAWERPDDVVEDLRRMFGKRGPCYGVVKGRSGYTSVTSKL